MEHPQKTLHAMGEPDEEEIRAAFDFFDEDGSGSIDVDELRTAFAGIGILDEELLQRLVRELDRDGNGEIDYKEFLAVTSCGAETPVKPESLSWQDVFQLFDTAKKENLSLDDLRTQFGGDIHDAQLRDILRLMSSNAADGSNVQVSSDEFVSYCEREFGSGTSVTNI